MSYVECKIPECGNSVFAACLCRKHYEKERLATAAPCASPGCTFRSFRGDLCERHYRNKIKDSKPRCVVPNCGEPQKNLKLGLCQRHTFRVMRHGSIEQPRPADWGSREAHPLYSIWSYHKRIFGSIVDEWKNDFWEFVKSVGEKPDGFTLRKKDPKKPLGPGNWYWKESFSNKDPAKYQREWRKRNPEKSKNSNLKKHFGITIEDYNKMGEAQKWKCDICGDLETSKDKDGGPRQMPVDHCHKTGKIRALLCTRCNRGLVLFKDDPALLRAAESYLQKHK